MISGAGVGPALRRRLIQALENLDSTLALDGVGVNRGENAGKWGTKGGPRRIATQKARQPAVLQRGRSQAVLGKGEQVGQRRSGQQAGDLRLGPAVIFLKQRLSLRNLFR